MFGTLGLPFNISATHAEQARQVKQAKQHLVCFAYFRSLYLSSRGLLDHSWHICSVHALYSTYMYTRCEDMRTHVHVSKYGISFSLPTSTHGSTQQRRRGAAVIPMRWRGGLQQLLLPHGASCFAAEVRPTMRTAAGPAFTARLRSLRKVWASSLNVGRHCSAARTDCTSAMLIFIRTAYYLWLL